MGCSEESESKDFQVLPCQQNSRSKMLGERQAGCRDAFAIFRLKDLCSKEELHFDPMQTISREKWLVFE
jgi:hypothetical protein